jgi:L-lactate dehydrogenase complex protein LldE
MSQTIQLFITCILDLLYPEVGEAVVRVLEKAGLQVEFPPDQTCCGQPAFNAGMRPEAARVARHTIQVFEATNGPVVVPSGSCTAMIRHGYPELFADDPLWLPRAQALAGRTFEFTEFLVDQLGITDFNSSFTGKVAYHASCHLSRDLGVKSQPRQLLQALRGATLVELPHAEDCCGFGGVFSVEHPQLSAEMLKRKMENIEASQAQWVVACDAGCITHINGGLHRCGKTQRAVHIAQLLDGSLGSQDPPQRDGSA